MNATTEPVMRHAGFAFAAEAASIPAARRFAVDKAEEWNSSVLGDDVALLVSEVVTNAVRHGQSGGIVELRELDGGGVHVEVSDDSTEVPVVGRGAPDDPSGRGLRIVESLASSWGVVPRRDGKSVWFELVADNHQP